MRCPLSAIGFRGTLFCDIPLQGLSLDCAHFTDRSRGVAAIVCDSTENTAAVVVRRGGGYDNFGRATKFTLSKKVASSKAHEARIIFHPQAPSLPILLSESGVEN